MILLAVRYEKQRHIDGELSLSAAACRLRDSITTQTAGSDAGWLPLEPTVRGSICGNGLTHNEGRPRCPSDHIDEILEGPPPEATPASAGRRHVLVMEIPP